MSYTKDVIKRKEPAATCSRGWGYDRCQRKGWYRVAGVRGSFCLQHTEIEIDRPLTPAERA